MEYLLEKINEILGFTWFSFYFSKTLEIEPIPFWSLNGQGILATVSVIPLHKGICMLIASDVADGENKVRLEVN